MTGELEVLIGARKRAFISRHLNRCGYLRVDVVEENGALRFFARFTLDKARTWHRAEADIALAAIGESGLEPYLDRAFHELDDGVEMARLAHLFKPMTAAQRMGFGRR